MRRFIIATHGTLADGLVESAAVVCGPEMVKGIKTVLMKADTNPEDFLTDLENFVAEDPEGEYFAMVDLFGASPCTTTVRALRNVEYRMVTGVNLGMLLEVLLNKEVSLIELEEKALNAGKEGVKSFYIKV